MEEAFIAVPSIGFVITLIIFILCKRFGPPDGSDYVSLSCAQNWDSIKIACVLTCCTLLVVMLIFTCKGESLHIFGITFPLFGTYVYILNSLFKKEIAKVKDNED